MSTVITSAEAKTISPINQRRFRVFVYTIVAIGIIGGGALVIKNVKYRFIAKRFSVVTPGIVYRSGQLSKWKLEPTLKENNIQAVVAMMGTVPPTKYHDFEIKRLEELGVPLIRHGLDADGVGLRGDGTGPVICYIDALCTIDGLEREGKPCLIHCSAGSSRTGVTIALYRLLLKKQSPESVYDEFVSLGGHAEREEKTIPYLNENIEHIARQLVERGVLDEMPESIPQLPVNDGWF
ncbi:MAG: hypothetical protein CMJ78_27415 [Planctomycetaceae bacterium]|nr:hypothetical protein [Planctomycetaceae bacterium]